VRAFRRFGAINVRALVVGLGTGAWRGRVSVSAKGVDMLRHRARPIRRQRPRVICAAAAVSIGYPPGAARVK